MKEIAEFLMKQKNKVKCEKCGKEFEYSVIDDVYVYLPTGNCRICCPHCGYEKEDWGYDDNYFHQKVIPDMKCLKCGKTENSDYVPRQTKYPENMEI